MSDLSDLIARDGIDMGDYYPSVHEAVHSDRRIGAIAVMADTLGVYCNRYHFDQAGLSYPRENRTLAVSQTAAEKSGQVAVALYVPFLRELRSAQLSAYQWPNMIPAFHFRDTFRTMVHAEDVEQVLQAAM